MKTKFHLFCRDLSLAENCYNFYKQSPSMISSNINHIINSFNKAASRIPNFSGWIFTYVNMVAIPWMLFTLNDCGCFTKL